MEHMKVLQLLIWVFNRYDVKTYVQIIDNNVKDEDDISMKDDVGRIFIAYVVSYTSLMFLPTTGLGATHLPSTCAGQPAFVIQLRLLSQTILLSGKEKYICRLEIIYFLT